MRLLQSRGKRARQREFEMVCTSIKENHDSSNVVHSDTEEVKAPTKEKHLGTDTIDTALQRGSIESGLVLVPTTLFFLMALQVLLAGSWQTIERARLHDLVIESSIRESISGSSQSLSGDSTYLSGDSLPSHGVSLDGAKAELIIQEESTPVGTIRTIEMSTPVPILGDFLRTFDRGVFQVRNYAVSFIN